jgi:hypothetical protein
MKALLTLVLACSCLFCYAQKSSVKIKIDGKYYRDTTENNTDTGRYLQSNEYINLIDLQGRLAIGTLGNKKVFFLPNQIIKTSELVRWMGLKMTALEKEAHGLEYQLAVQRFGKKYAIDVINKKVRIGQPMPVVKEILGDPTDKHNTITSKGTNSQWVYRDGLQAAYCYFVNGILTAIQN